MGQEEIQFKNNMFWMQQMWPYTGRLLIKIKQSIKQEALQEVQIWGSMCK